MWNEKKKFPHFRVTPLIFWGLAPKERGNIKTWNFGIGVLQQFGTTWHVAKIVLKNHCTLLPMHQPITSCIIFASPCASLLQHASHHITACLTFDSLCTSLLQHASPLTHHAPACYSMPHLWLTMSYCSMPHVFIASQPVSACCQFDSTWVSLLPHSESLTHYESACFSMPSYDCHELDCCSMSHVFLPWVSLLQHAQRIFAMS